MKKYTGRPIEENIDSVVVFKYSACVLKWMSLKYGRVCALIRGATKIEVRILLKGDSCMVRVTAEVPKDLWKCRTDTEFL